MGGSGHPPAPGGRAGALTLPFTGFVGATRCGRPFSSPDSHREWAGTGACPYEKTNVSPYEQAFEDQFPLGRERQIQNRPSQYDSELYETCLIGV